MNEILRQVLIVLVVMGAVLGAAAMLIWLERRLLGIWQDRLGPNRVGPLGLLQPLADVVKIAKEDWIPPFADRPVFVIAPTIVVLAGLMAFTVIPFTPTVVVVDLDIGLLFVLAMFSLSVYSVVLGGWSSRSKYALLGGCGRRPAAQLRSLHGAVPDGGGHAGGLLQPARVVAAQKGLWFCVPQFPRLVIFLIAGIAESHRLPLDIPEAESELIAGYHTEYSGMKFGLFFVGEYRGSSSVGLYRGPVFRGVDRAAAAPHRLVRRQVSGLHLRFHPAARGPAAAAYDQLMGIAWKRSCPWRC